LITVPLGVWGNILKANADFGTFAPKVDYTTGTTPGSVAIGNLNADTYPDLAVTNANDNTVSVLLNNSNGTFASKVDYTTEQIPSRLPSVI